MFNDKNSLSLSKGKLYFLCFVCILRIETVAFWSFGLAMHVGAYLPVIADPLHARSSLREEPTREITQGKFFLCVKDKTLLR